MKKKLLVGCFAIPLLFCLPIFQLNLSRDSALPESAEAAAAPEEPAPAPAPASEPPPEDTAAPPSIYSSVGILTYYNQNDPRWAHSKYGGNDSISVYGCGPTALAMIVSSFTGQTMTPADMAAWAYSNHYWVSGSGSKHSLIPEGASAFGFLAEPFYDLSAEGIISALKSGHIFVALMGPGHFTDNGHFIIIADYWSGNQVTVADPNSQENTLVPWDINLILSELNRAANNGGPVWMITPN